MCCERSTPPLESRYLATALNNALNILSNVGRAEGLEYTKDSPLAVAMVTGQKVSELWGPIGIKALVKAAGTEAFCHM